MAHFAKLDENNVVLEVHCVHNNELMIDGVESEAKGVAFLVMWSNGYPFWKQTSYNGTFRKNYAGIGYIYDPEMDAFYPPATFPSWTLDKEVGVWVPPVPRPTDDKFYVWVEEARQWIEYTPSNAIT
jgi:hypothetical protein